MVTKTQAIKNMLRLASSDLAKLYNKNMEVQVNVKSNGGKRISTKSPTPVYKNIATGETWKSFRIPFNADTKPNYTDHEIGFDLTKYAEGIGMSGWDFVNQETCWVGFDIDSLVDHRVGLTEEQMKELLLECKKVPYVNVYKSTGGAGYHIYIFFSQPIKTKNHNEHAAIAKAMVQMLTIETGYKFEASIDCCGSILWVWHTKQQGTDGLSCVIQAQEKFNSSKIPANWMNFIKSKTKSKRLKSYNKDIQDLALTIKSSKLDERHKAVLKWFPRKAKRIWWWDNDLSMLVCHTQDLKDCHTELDLTGVFETISPGEDTEQNCFCFPIFNGGFTVRRYNVGTPEAETWERDDKNWTKTVFNVKPTFDTSCLFRGGQLDSKNFYNFSDGLKVNRVLKDLDIPFQLNEKDPQEINRTYLLKIKHKKLLISTINYGDIPKGFLKNKNEFEKMLSFRENMSKQDSTLILSDDIIRHVISLDTDAGWYIEVNHKWIFHNKNNVADVLLSQNPMLNGKEIKIFLGEQILEPWILVNEPFKPEYLGGRQWNKDAPQFKYEPVSGEHPTWDAIFNHLGLNIDNSVQNDEWCKKNDILTGGEFLFMWAASMFRRPYLPLPYLFFWSIEQNNGKSTFHESLSLLFKDDNGYTRADYALKNDTGFNNELRNAVLCVVEETDLSANKQANERMKDWVTGLKLAIRAMYKDTYLVSNNTHWVQCSNSPGACPILRGDTRIMPINVPILKQSIPRENLHTKLKEEAPYFMYSIMNIELPLPHSRLALPCLGGKEKEEMELVNATLLERFIHEVVFEKKGHKIKFSQFYNAFLFYLDSKAPNKKSYYTERRVSMNFLSRGSIIKGKYKGDGQAYIFNASLDFNSEEDKNFIYSSKGKYVEKIKLTKIKRKDA